MKGQSDALNQHINYALGNTFDCFSRRIVRGPCGDGPTVDATSAVSRRRRFAGRLFHKRGQRLDIRS